MELRAPRVYNISYNHPEGTRVRGRPKNRWMDCVLSDMTKMQDQELEVAVKGQRDIDEVHYGGEGPHWATVPLKKKNNTIIPSAGVH